MPLVRFHTHNELLLQFDDSERISSTKLVERAKALATSIDENLAYASSKEAGISDDDDVDVVRFSKPYQESSQAESDSPSPVKPSGPGLSQGGIQLPPIVVGPGTGEGEGEPEPPPTAVVRLYVSDPATMNSPEEERINAERSAVLRFITTAHEKRNDQSSRDLGFQYAAPNWLFASSQGTMPTGGPGGRPTPVPLPAQGAPRRARHFKKGGLDTLLTIYDGLLSLLGIGLQVPNQINVVVLDTAPAADVLNDAYTKYPNNKLLHSLRSKLHITYADKLGIKFPHSDPPPDPALTEITPQTTAEDKAKNDAIDFYRRSGGYKMPDHGLFVAGIIHDIAPEANIYLVEVLNEYGLGTLDSINRGLAAIEQGALRNQAGSAVIFDNDPLVINMSLCIDFGIEDLDSTSDKTSLLNLSLDVLKWTLHPMFSPLNRLQGLPLDKEDLEDAVKGAKRMRNAVAVAAAGNEADPSTSTPPDARYPAAYDGVIGVGALDSHGQRAWYSNLADTPPAVGIAVLGGNAQPPAAGKKPSRLDSTSMSKESLEGLYVSPYFPNEEGKIDPIEAWKNHTGKAWWCGTSFATAIASGILASIAKRGISLGDTLLDAGDFIKFVTLINGSTLANEPILNVSQEEKDD